MYGLVVAVGIDYIKVIPANCLYDSDGRRRCYCYDESSLDRYKHNVRLKSSSGVFTGLNSMIVAGGTLLVDNVFVVADMRKVLTISDDDFIKFRVRLIDDGAKISDSDWDEVCNHLFSTQPQKEFTHHGYRQGSDKVADISKDDDTQFGD